MHPGICFLILYQRKILIITGLRFPVMLVGTRMKSWHGMIASTGAIRPEAMYLPLKKTESPGSKDEIIYRTPPSALLLTHHLGHNIYF